jgi:hypothetical protein
MGKRRRMPVVGGFVHDLQSVMLHIFDNVSCHKMKIQESSKGHHINAHPHPYALQLLPYNMFLSHVLILFTSHHCPFEGFVLV